MVNLDIWDLREQSRLLGAATVNICIASHPIYYINIQLPESDFVVHTNTTQDISWASDLDDCPDMEETRDGVFLTPIGRYQVSDQWVSKETRDGVILTLISRYQVSYQWTIEEIRDGENLAYKETIQCDIEETEMEYFQLQLVDNRWVIHEFPKKLEKEKS